MSRKGQPALAGSPPAPSAVVVNFPMPTGTRFDWHRHDDHQLAWAPHGVLTVSTDSGSYVLPPTRALWIPAGVRHRTATATGVATMRALYLRPLRCPVGWAAPTPIGVGPLLAELIDHLADPDLPAGPRARAEAVLADLLQPVPMSTIDLRMPLKPPASRVAAALVNDPADGRDLAAWGRQVGTSSRTLARAFRADTGLPFGRWRSLLRLRAAVHRLATGGSVATVGRQVGYRTSSAFVAAFRRETGLTPGDYFRADRPRSTGTGARGLRAAGSGRLTRRADTATAGRRIGGVPSGG